MGVKCIGVKNRRKREGKKEKVTQRIKIIQEKKSKNLRLYTQTQIRKTAKKKYINTKGGFFLSFTRTHLHTLSVSFSHLKM